jgi:signal transduction histidine kinase
VEELRQAADRLHVEIAALRASRARLVRRADAERRALERELHDGVQQHLVGAAAALELARRLAETEPESLGDRLDEIARDLRRGLDDATGLAQRLYPPMLEAGGLASALRSAAAAAGVPVSLRVPATRRYPPEVAGAVYFSCLDLLEQAPLDTEATVTVRDEDQALAFDVTVGALIDSDGIRDRVEALGGSLTVHLETDDRTRVSGSLPLPR